MRPAPLSNVLVEAMWTSPILYAASALWARGEDASVWARALRDIAGECARLAAMCAKHGITVPVQTDGKWPLVELTSIHELNDAQTFALVSAAREHAMLIKLAADLEMTYGMPVVVRVEGAAAGQ